MAAGAAGELGMGPHLIFAVAQKIINSIRSLTHTCYQIAGNICTQLNASDELTVQRTTEGTGELTLDRQPGRAA